MDKYSYKFSPSLLQAYQDYLDSEALYEKFYGFSEEPSLTYQEYEEKQFKELIDKINRVPFDSEAADRGSALNEIVDCIVLHQKSTRDDIKVRTVVPEGVGEIPYIEAKMKERTFCFDIAFCKQIAKYFEDSLCQIYTEAPIETSHGTVLLYGYPDYVRGDMVYDLKTTSKYEFGKYAKYWQQHVYPWTLIESGRCTEVKAFEFTAFAMKGGSAKQPLIYGDMYPEVYVYNHERSTQLLRGICTQFAEFLEANRNRITDEKIFGGEKSNNKQVA